jgi:hypothetical protein
MNFKNVIVQYDNHCKGVINKEKRRVHTLALSPPKFCLPIEVKYLTKSGKLY